jgi:hypothetical protein
MIVPAGIKVDLALGWRAAAYYGAQFGDLTVGSNMPTSLDGGDGLEPRRVDSRNSTGRAPRDSSDIEGCAVGRFFPYGAAVAVLVE